MNFQLTLFFLWRITLFIIAWFGSLQVKFAPSFPYSDILLFPSGLPIWVWTFANFDGVHYINIAKSGYSAQFTQVFFPLYPFLIKFVNLVLPFLNTIIIGLLVSNISFLISLILLQKLMRLDYKQKQTEWILLFLLFFPTSFFFGSLYTESLFFLFLILSFYAARKNKWWLASVVGALAGATRLIGIFLLPALLWEWQKDNIKHQKYNFKYFFSFLRSPILYIVPLGLISYMIYLQLTYHDALYFWHVQPIFGAERTGGSVIFPPQVIFRYMKILAAISYHKYIFWISFSELFSTILAVFLLIWAHAKKIRLSYLIFSWLAILVPTITGTLSSMPRYILVAFPVFITMGLIRSNFIKILLIAFDLFLLFLYTIAFTSGRWVS